jgi:hypothetical protein
MRSLRNLIQVKNVAWCYSFNLFEKKYPNAGLGYGYEVLCGLDQGRGGLFPVVGDHALGGLLGDQVLEFKGGGGA